MAHPVAVYLWAVAVCLLTADELYPSRRVAFSSELSSQPRCNMGFLDRFVRRPEPEETPAVSTSPQSELLSEVPTSEGLRETLPDFSLVGSETFSGLPSSSGESSVRLYNPYEGLNASIDNRPLKAPYKLPTQPEFLFSEEATVHRRSWSENLTFYTGAGYLTGRPWIFLLAIVCMLT
jgi:hypothetical protein